MAPEKNIPNGHGLATILQKQVMEVTDKIQVEMKRLIAHPNESSGNATLYRSMADQALKIKAEAFNPDVMTSLDIIVEKLKQSEQLAKDGRPNRDILAHLQLVNCELSKAKNIKG